MSISIQSQQGRPQQDDHSNGRGRGRFIRAVAGRPRHRAVAVELPWTGRPQHDSRGQKRPRQERPHPIARAAAAGQPWTESPQHKRTHQDQDSYNTSGRSRTGVCGTATGQVSFNRSVRIRRGKSTSGCDRSRMVAAQAGAAGRPQTGMSGCIRSRRSRSGCI